MGIVWTPATLAAGLRSEFVLASQVKPDPTLDQLMMKVPSTKRSETYGWLGQVNDLREWVDSKTLEALTDHTYSVPNVPYEGTLQLKRTDIVDDQVGAAPQRIRDLTTKGRFHPQRLLIDAMAGGDAALCYDGQYFYDTDHSEGASGTQSNKLTGTGSTTAQLQADFRAARAAILGFKDSKGKPIFETATNIKWVVTAPVGLFGAFEELQNAAIISNTTNVIKGLFDLVALPRLTTDDVNNWMLHAIVPGMSPFILQEREALSFHALEGESDTGFFRDLYSYSVHWRGAVSYGWWQTSVLTTN